MSVIRAGGNNRLGLLAAETTEQFFSTDGKHWSRVEAPVELEAATEMSVASGPGGVIDLSSSSAAPRGVHVWRLTGGEQGP